MNKRIINIRPLFVAFAALIFGILTYNLIFLIKPKTIAGMIFSGAFISLFIISIIFLLLTIVKSFSLNAFIKLIKKHKTSLVLFVLFFVMGFVSLMANDFYNKKSLMDFDGNYNIVGRIKDNYYETEGSTVLVLDSVKLTGDNNTYSLKSNLKLVIFQTGIIGNENLAGKSIAFNSDIEKTPFGVELKNYNAYIKNTVYFASISSGFLFSSGSMKPDEFIRSAYKGSLQEKLSPEDANLAYSLLFGFDQMVSDEITDLFTNTGVIHIISVSGLHVAVFAGLVLGLLKLLKVNKKYDIIIFFISLLLYSYLSGFVPSVIRSSVMCMVFILSKRLGQRYDTITSLSFSGILLLAITPYNLFGLGFQLSFISMFGLITLTPLITSMLKKAKIPSSVSSLISLTLGATILTAPVILYTFNQIPTYSVFSNILVVPVMSLSYVMLFFITTLGLFLPFILNLLFLPNILLHFSKIVLNIISKLPYSTISLTSDGYVTLFLVIILSIVLRYLMISNKSKAGIVAVLMSFIIGITFYVNAPNINLRKTSFYANYQKESSVSLVVNDLGKSMIVGSDFANDYYFNKFKLKYKISKVDVLLVNDFNFKGFNNVLKLSNNYNIKDIIFLNLSENEKDYVSARLKDRNLHFETESVDFMGFVIESYYQKDLLATSVLVNDKFILFIKNNINVANMRQLNYLLHNDYFDIIVYNGTYNWINELSIDYDYLVVYKGSYDNDNISNLKLNSDFTYKL